MQDWKYLLGVFFVMGAVTFALRLMPFVGAKWLQKQRWVKSLGEFLPLAIMVLLTLHATVSGPVSAGRWPVIEGVALTLAIALQWFFRNPLVSILLATALYIALFNEWLPIRALGIG